LVSNLNPNMNRLQFLPRDIHHHNMCPHLLVLLHNLVDFVPCLRLSTFVLPYLQIFSPLCANIEAVHQILQIRKHRFDWHAHKHNQARLSIPEGHFCQLS
jgi:hypothetical protein